MSSQYALLGQRRFAPFFGVQFLGAMNDNVFKQALVIMLTFNTAQYTTMDSGLLQNLAQALFILPYFLFSATAGQLADKYEKSRLIGFTLLIELSIMVLGAIGFFTKNLTLLFTALFLGGLQSTLFGPVKYAILPQHLKDSELLGGNGLVEMGTSVAILVGMMVGGWMVSQPGWGITGVAVLTMSMSALGYGLSRLIPKAPPLVPELRINWNPFTETWRNLKFARTNRTVFLSMMGISWFWFVGSIFATQFPDLAKNVFHGKELVVTVLLVVFSVGIGIGSLLCERLSGKKVEIGLVPFGSIGITVFGVDLYFAVQGLPVRPAIDWLPFIQDSAHWRALFDLTMIGLFGGFFIVPLYAMIQQRSEPTHRSRIIAANNILNALFMVVAAAMAIAMLKAGLTVPQILLVTALLNAVVAAYIYRLVPEFLMRFLVWLLVHTVYRLRVRAVEENIPEEGAAVVVCNHVSFVDALVIAAGVRRPIRFVMDHNIFKVPLMNFIFREARTIPIASAKEDPAMKDRAFEEIARALDAGEVVGIFPEGGLTKDGELAPFRPGISQILARNPVAVVPLALRGLWGSFFSRVDGKAMRRVRGVLSRIELVGGAPIPPEQATLETLQARVLELRGDWK